MIQILQIFDSAMRERIIHELARREGVHPEEVPPWYELDDVRYAELLAEMHDGNDLAPAPQMNEYAVQERTERNDRVDLPPEVGDHAVL